MDIGSAVWQLVDYGVRHLELDKQDAVYTQNLVYAMLKTTGVDTGGKNIGSVDRDGFVSLLGDLSDYAIGRKVIEEGERDSFETALTGIVSLKPSEVINKFDSFDDIAAACDWFYKYCIDNNYIRMQDIVKNKYWAAQNTDRLLEITINLSKPEKSNADIAKERTVVRSSYPKCVLCEQNIGNYGGGGYPARQNLRTIPITLGGERWFWQYSPYVYYDQHCIAVNAEHTPMQVSGKTFGKLLDFVDKVGHYFIGCNASLPIIGGSILMHDHFQGGKKQLPMHGAKAKTALKSVKYKQVKASVPDWYNSVIRLESADRGAIESLCADILNKWKDYSNPDINIAAYTGDTPHNSLAPIARKSGGVYIMDLILRNNRTDSEHPDGIFHAHKQYHNIKSEGIGLIEAMGLFILPARLERQSAEIAKFLTGGAAGLNTLAADMEIHRDFIGRLVDKYGSANTTERAAEIIKEEIALVCQNILINTAVFKPNDEGERAFIEFLNTCGLQ